MRSKRRVDEEAEALRSHQERKADFYTILVSGVDDGNGNSDTNILVAVDTAEGPSMASAFRGIPRRSGMGRAIKSMRHLAAEALRSWRM